MNRKIQCAALALLLLVPAARTQSAYRIEVASSREALLAGRADVWASGRVGDRESLLVRYAGPLLEPARTYSWRVRATGDGTVVEATRNGASGNYVKLRHNNRYETYYLHLSRFGRGVRSGAHVSQGQVIGYVGATGLATGPHLDYRIRVNGTFINPRTIALPSRDPVPTSEMAAFEQLKITYLAGLLDARAANETIAFGKPVYNKQPRQARLF